jgi:hypothetical protein
MMGDFLTAAVNTMIIELRVTLITVTSTGFGPKDQF